MRSAYLRYTAEEDAEILKARNPNEIRRLAIRLGRTANAITLRRTNLRAGTTTAQFHKVHKDTPPPPRPAPPSRFARPDFFSEDLSRLATIRNR